jgi:hypothetical protein
LASVSLTTSSKTSPHARSAKQNSTATEGVNSWPAVMDDIYCCRKN